MPDALTMSMAYLQQENALQENEVHGSHYAISRDQQTAHRLHKLTLRLAQADADAALPDAHGAHAQPVR